MILVDTNVLLRTVQPEHPMHDAATGAIALLMEKKESMVISAQNVAEFWNAATRPSSNNGLGLSAQEAEKEITHLESFFEVIHEDARSYAEWKALIIAHRVIGVQVHDARLAALMKSRSIQTILTFNSADFQRYPGIEAVHPATVGSDR